MCEIDWSLLSGFISAVASLANAALLIWMILVTKNMFKQRWPFLMSNRRSFENSRQQYLALIDREIRPLRIPAHREHPFRSIVSSDSGPS
jgi:hypothetical protein